MNENNKSQEFVLLDFHVGISYFMQKLKILYEENLSLGIPKSLTHEAQLYLLDKHALIANFSFGLLQLVNFSLPWNRQFYYLKNRKVETVDHNLKISFDLYYTFFKACFSQVENKKVVNEFQYFGEILEILFAADPSFKKNFLTTGYIGINYTLFNLTVAKELEKHFLKKEKIEKSFFVEM